MKHIILVAATLFSVACSFSKKNDDVGGRNPNAVKFTSAELETDKDDVEFAEFVETMDLENATTSATEENLGKFFFEYKKSSTSAGVKISIIEKDKEGKIDLDKVGKWVPENSANNVEAQVVSYYIGRFLQMTDLVVASSYYTMGQKGLALFKPMLKCANEKGQHKDNCVKILNAINKNPSSMIGSYTNHVKDEKEVLNMNTFKGQFANNGKLNSNHIIAKFIKANGPMPSADKKMNLNLSWVVDGKKITPEETELELAKQFSKIMVLDILTGQWDRFSGGNIEAIYKKKKNVVQFIAQDNGGASMVGKAKRLYFEAVTRFDRAQIVRVEELRRFLIEDRDATISGIGLKSKPDSLIQRCDELLAHVQTQIKAHGEAKVFFP
jgi:hypothetical protein